MEISTTGLEGIGIFQDDIIVAGKTFSQNSIEYLGHKIDEHGLHTLTKHINAIQSALVPENKTIAADILKPLYSLLRQEKKWLWSPECDQAYNNINKMLISSPVLAHYDQKLPIKLTVDSSSYALGAIISHTYPDHSERPIAYASRVLSNSECKFPQIEKEDEGSEWIRHTDQIWPHNQINNSLSPTPARQANENSKNTETVGENQSPDPADPVIVNKTPRPIKSRKPPQRYSPSDYA
ncbi:unnamed protein product [Macrosiphum euphorbiae]|uniref:Reverse transcriptase/retrotransposon-derived protein RNase H-like domain-containing protein n=1 Tax=Macrosiphum euphorbiae TaxID=13131 RepID=A0AAV0XX12_9HEMI|nr:unnamed protein product [Macrosiphum euphorbiae]